jgi:hypothetical protein
LILGLRIFIGIRFVAQIPQGDDYRTLIWLQKFSEGIHDWGFIWQRSNGHFFVFYYLANLGQYLLDGYWDPRLDFLVYALVHVVEAAVVIFTFQNVLVPRDRWWILAFIFFLFAVPFGGYRIAWGNLWVYSDVMIFGLAALYLTAYHGEKWIGVIVVILIAGMGALNLAAGCLGAAAVAGMVLIRAVGARRVAPSDAALFVGSLVIFLVFFLTLPRTGAKIGFLECCNAFLRSLAWPVVFLPAAGLVAAVPLIGLGAAYFLSPSFQRKNVHFVVGVGGLIFLLALATGAFRGDNNNMGMPSGRYTDIFLVVPLVCGVALCMLYRGSSGNYRLGWAVFASVWVALQVLGFSVHLLYRTIPFVAMENGEWIQPYKQVFFRDLVRGADKPIYSNSSPLYNEALDLELDQYTPQEMLDIVQGRAPMPAMTIPMITGFPLVPGSYGNYLAGGYDPSYRPRPGQLYVGSFDADDRATTNRWFISGAFRPTAPYVTVDILLDKKARFANYRMNGVSLALHDETTGQWTELLPRLSHAFPFVLRDWEWVYARVVPGDEYRIESSSNSPSQWIAFGEPFESGRLTPLIVGLCLSGKLICFCGFGLLVLAFGLYRLGDAQDEIEFQDGSSWGFSQD